MAMITLHPTAHRDVFTDGSDFEPLWSHSQDFGGECYWHQSGYGSLPESDVSIVPDGVQAVSQQQSKGGNSDGR